jgi:hypothetical protein
LTSKKQLFQKLHELLSARPQEMMENDSAEGCSRDAAQREVSEREGEIAGAERQGDTDRQEIARVGEVDPVVDQIRPAVAAMRPNTTIDKSPITGSGTVRTSAPCERPAPRRSRSTTPTSRPHAMSRFSF